MQRKKSGLIAQRFQRGQGRLVVLFCQTARAVQPIQRNKGRLFHLPVAAHRLAQFLGGGGDIQNVIHDLEYEPQFRRVGHERRRRAFRSAGGKAPQPDRRADQRPGLMGVQSEELLFRRFAGLVVFVQFLAVEHAAGTARFGQGSRRLCAAFRRQRSVCDHLKGGRHQRVRSQQRHRLPKLLMAAGAAAAEIVIVHAGQVVMDQGIAMQHLQRTGIVQRRILRAAPECAGGQRQNGADPLAAPQKAVPCRCADLFFGGQIGVAQFCQAPLGFLGPFSKKGLVILMGHTFSPV